jgi:hypothetical protein
VGVTLIAVPFWWDKSLPSLAATIRLYRPDLLEEGPRGIPISTKIPKQLAQKFQYKPNVGQKYDAQLDPTGWYHNIVNSSNQLQVDDGKI